jgi:hypothetical protein
MSCLRLKGVQFALCLLLGSRIGMAIDAGTVPRPGNPASANNTDIGTSSTPAVMALPANTAPLPGDASTTRKFYTLTASLREIYDDNVNTAQYNAKSSLETEFSPSVLVDFPTPEGDFSARYTLNITYYSTGPDAVSNSGQTSSEVKYTHDFLAQYTHAFSDRFNLALADEFRSFTEPSIDQSTGTSYQNGPYITNVFNGTLSSQWTPLLGTSTTYSNTITRYDDSSVAMFQNSVENIGSQTFSFAFFPKVSLSFGGIVDDISYDDVARGYTNYTGFVGAQWQALPSLSITGRGGASYTEYDVNFTQISPYAALSVNWGLGAHSSLSFSYAHEVTPAEQGFSSGQTSDRFSGGFNYNITSSLSASLQGIFTYGVVGQQAQNSGQASYNQNNYEIDPGLTYHYNNYLDFNAGFVFSGVTGDSNVVSTYERNQAFLGVRGTY